MSSKTNSEVSKELYEKMSKLYLLITGELRPCLCIPVDTRSVIPVIPVHSGCDFRYGFTKLVLFT